jgi:hypothetical protein
MPFMVEANVPTNTPNMVNTSASPTVAHPVRTQFHRFDSRKPDTLMGRLDLF